ncbi:MAG: hypothetical protein AMJ45_00135 [Syntrophobacter sp. DG_60]|nr:MAG: hypothetical protein AMJ45_00135 [Syntrophobacter sp. DG_60]
MWKIALFFFFLAIIWQVINKFLKLRKLEKNRTKIEERRTKPPFEEIWLRIITHRGQTFYTKANIGFTYEVVDHVLYLSTDHKIYKDDFKKAYTWFPADDPADIRQQIRGLAYVWAILHDKRISM